MYLNKELSVISLSDDSALPSTRRSLDHIASSTPISVTHIGINLNHPALFSFKQPKTVLTDRSESCNKMQQNIPKKKLELVPQLP
jgi:hypothetical protein